MKCCPWIQAQLWYNTWLYNTADCLNGELRLVEGETELEGRLEVCFGQRWGTVGNDGWTEVNSQVLCNAFGYDFTGMTKRSIATHNVFFHQVEGIYLLLYPQISL